ncbi:MAG: hypothetical protein OXF68_01435 [Gammaproteobacteria bacterium]|nr:hypothetical protein [Gammaproteobacteria bacterium]
MLLKDVTSEAQSEHDINVVSFTPSMCPNTETLNAELLRGVEVPETVARSVQGGLKFGQSTGAMQWIIRGSLSRLDRWQMSDC